MGIVLMSTVQEVYHFFLKIKKMKKKIKIKDQGSEIKDEREQKKGKLTTPFFRFVKKKKKKLSGIKISAKEPIVYRH